MRPHCCSLRSVLLFRRRRGRHRRRRRREHCSIRHRRRRHREHCSIRGRRWWRAAPLLAVVGRERTSARVIVAERVRGTCALSVRRGNRPAPARG